mmetsp:Transcript_38260/g.108444  ORF Transcript_38260/g.108444 Transcript_38260/m.108444 type:complete len:292 (+) Transcript_38260:181-1056(+)
MLRFEIVLQRGSANGHHGDDHLRGHHLVEQGDGDQHGQHHRGGVREDSGDVVRVLEDGRDSEAIQGAVDDHRPSPSIVAGEEAPLEDAPLLQQSTCEIEEHAPEVHLAILPMDGILSFVLQHSLRVEPPGRREKARAHHHGRASQVRALDGSREAPRNVAGRRPKGQLQNRQVLHDSQLAGEEEPKQQCREDRLQLAHQLERGRRDVSQNEEHQVVVQEVNDSRGGKSQRLACLGLHRGKVSARLQQRGGDEQLGQLRQQHGGHRFVVQSPLRISRQSHKDRLDSHEHHTQ